MGYDFKHKKFLGQHFLVNQEVISNIIFACDKINEKNIIEIGPGNLALTSTLVENAKTVLAIEKDSSLRPVLEGLKKNKNNFDYIITDALKFDIKSKLKDTNILVSNLPYNVGTQIYLDYLFLAHHNPGLFDYFVLMFQKEVALRICAKEEDNNYGRLSIISNLLADCEILFEVTPDNFNPPPKVDSAVIKVTPLKQKRINVDINKLEKITQLGFSLRRKTIRNSLKNLNIDFEKLGINPQKRAEELSLAEICLLANNI